MSRSIKLSDKLFERVQRLQRPRETYGEVVERSISLLEKMSEMSDTLGPGHYLQERPAIGGKAKGTIIERYQGEDGVWYERKVRS